MRTGGEVNLAPGGVPWEVAVPDATAFLLVDGAAGRQDPTHGLRSTSTS